MQLCKKILKGAVKEVFNKKLSILIKIHSKNDSIIGKSEKLPLTREA